MKRRSSKAGLAGGGASRTLRIIGGALRGRRWHDAGDARTRPMKDRVREAAFNLLGPVPPEAHGIDLFAGTGALGFEAISRGARDATLVEQHFPTARRITESARHLGIAERVCVVPGDTFIWARQLPDTGGRPWLIFCCPPYALYQQRLPEMLQLIVRMVEAAPAGSRFVVEADRHFDTACLPQPEAWDCRAYPPAMLAVRRMA